MFVPITLAVSLVLSPLSQAPLSLTWAGPPTTSGTVAPTSGPASGPTAAPALAPAPAAAKPAAAPAKAAAQPAGAGGCKKLDYRTRVEVDAAGLGDDAQGVATRLRSKTEQELQRNDIMLGTAEAGELPLMLIKVVPLPGEDEGFSFTIDITHAGQPIKDGSSVGECPLCTESELLEKVVGATRSSLAPKLRAYILDHNNKPCQPEPADGAPVCKTKDDCKDPANPVCSQTGKCVAGDECKSDADCAGSVHGPACHRVIKKCVPAAEAHKDPPPPQGMNVKQKAGIGLMVLGALGAGVGIGLAVKKPVPVDPYMAWETRSTRIPGFVLLAAGGVSLVTGIVLFALGRRQQARSQVTPVAGAGFYGLSWSGRF